jgi:hypothetical protein
MPTAHCASRSLAKRSSARVKQLLAGTVRATFAGRFHCSGMAHRDRLSGEEGGAGYGAAGLVATLIATAIASLFFETFEHRPAARLVVSEVSDSQNGSGYVQGLVAPHSK